MKQLLHVDEDALLKMALTMNDEADIERILNYNNNIDRLNAQYFNKELNDAEQIT